MKNSWQSVGKIHFREVTKTKLQLHYAVQFIAAAAAALIEPQPDESHLGLQWSAELNAFVGKVIETTIPFQVALDSVNLTLLIIDEQGYKILAFPLVGKTMVEGLEWLKKSLNQLGAKVDQLQFPAYMSDFPPHQLAEGGTFDLSEEAVCRELTAYYANTNILFEQIVQANRNAYPIQISSHHLNIATSIALPTVNYQEEMAYISLGMSPGDGNYDEPYWYVTLWPYPDINNLPPLKGNGFWHTKGWVGAILIGSQLLDYFKAEVQQAQVKVFFSSALQASRFLLTTESNNLL
jgi:hypothetical protein